MEASNLTAVFCALRARAWGCSGAVLTGVTPAWPEPVIKATLQLFGVEDSQGARWVANSKGLKGILVFVRDLPSFLATPAVIINCPSQKRVSPVECGTFTCDGGLVFELSAPDQPPAKGLTKWLAQGKLPTKSAGPAKQTVAPAKGSGTTTQASKQREQSPSKTKRSFAQALGRKSTSAVSPKGGPQELGRSFFEKPIPRISSSLNNETKGNSYLLSHRAKPTTNVSTPHSPALPPPSPTLRSPPPSPTAEDVSYFSTARPQAISIPIYDSDGEDDVLLMDDHRHRSPTKQRRVPPFLL
jgi:hypothetical protein